MANLMLLGRGVSCGAGPGRCYWAGCSFGQYDESNNGQIYIVIIFISDRDMVAGHCYGYIYMALTAHVHVSSQGLLTSSRRGATRGAGNSALYFPKHD